MGNVRHIRHQTGGRKKARVHLSQIEQKIDGTIIKIEIPAYEGGGTVLRRSRDLQQAELQERALGSESASRSELFSHGAAKQVQQQRDARLLSRDVILQVGVKLLVSPIDLRRQTDEKSLFLERRQAEELRQSHQRQIEAGCRCRHTTLLDALLKLVELR